MVPNDSILAENHMKVIKEQLVSDKYSENVQKEYGIPFYDCKNVNFIIRDLKTEALNSK